MGTATGYSETNSRSADAKHLDELLDEALAESFPASDPVAISVGRNPKEAVGAGDVAPTSQLSPPSGHETAIRRAPR